MYNVTRSLLLLDSADVFRDPSRQGRISAI